MQPSLKKNYIYRVLYEILILITPFITTPYISRVLGADGVGDYSFSHSIITYFMLFGALGTMSYGTREIAQHRDDKYASSKLFWEIELMTVITSGISLIVWIGVIIFSSKYKLLYLALTPFLLSTMFDISWFFTGFERIKNIVVRNSIVKIVGILLLFVLVRDRGDVYVYCLINSVTALAGNLSMWLYLPGMLTKVDFRDFQIKRHFKETLVYFIPTIAASVYTVLDKSLIGAITKDSYQNGYYEQATKVIKMVKSIVFVAVNSIMGARISYLFSDNKIDEIKRRISRSMDFIYFLAYGTMFGLVGIASRFVPLFFGKGYEPVIELLYFMTPLVVIVGTSNCLGNQYYTPSGQRKKSAMIIVLGAFVNLCLNLLLIPRFGSYGATFGSVVAELVISVIYVNKSSGFMTWRKLWEFSYKRIFAGFIMLLCVKSVGIIPYRPAAVVLLLQICCGVVVYFAILYFMHDSMIKELLLIGQRFVKKLLKKKV